MSNNYGECDFCGEEAELTCVGDDNICPECLKEYAYCDKCGGYFPPDVISAYHLKDGRTLCEDCAIYDLNFEGLTEADIESIDGEESKDETEDDC